MPCHNNWDHLGGALPPHLILMDIIQQVAHFLASNQSPGCCSAKGQDCLGVQCPKHCIKPRCACYNFIRLRNTIAWRSATDQVGDEHLIVRHHPDGFHQLIKRPPGRTNKGIALFIFLLPWRLAHNHQIHLWCPSPECLFLPLLGQFAPLASSPTVLNALEFGVHVHVHPAMAFICANLVKVSNEANFSRFNI